MESGRVSGKAQTAAAATVVILASHFLALAQGAAAADGMLMAAVGGPTGGAEGQRMHLEQPRPSKPIPNQILREPGGHHTWVEPAEQVHPPQMSRQGMLGIT